MRPTPLIMITLAALLALSGVALAAKDHGQHVGSDQQGQHGNPTPRTPALPAITPPTPTPSPVRAPTPVRAPQLPSQRAASAPAPIATSAPHYILHAGFVGLDSPPIETAMASVNTAGPDSPTASLRWALPLVGLVGIGAVVMTTRRPATKIATAQQPVLHIAGADARSLLEAGRAATARGALDEAVAWFTQAARLDPTIHVAHFCRGVCLSALGQHEEAYADYLRALDLDASEGAYHLAFARASARTARLHEAMDALSGLLEAEPTLAEDIIADDAFAALGDHPRFLAMTGRL